MEENDVDRIVRKILSEEVSEHRSFLAEQFKQITWGIGILFSVAAALFAFMLGKSINDAEKKVVQTIDDKVFEYRIAKDLKNKVNEHVKIAVSNNVKSKETKLQLEEQIKVISKAQLNETKNEIQDSIRKVIKDEINSNKSLDAEELIKKHVLPRGAVLTFNSSNCPSGWLEYTPAYGRFIRGIDKSGAGIDPGGERAPGSYQADALKKHNHSYKDVYWMEAWGSVTSMGNRIGDSGGDSDNKGYEFDRKTATIGQSDESRPKNIALLFCVKE